MNRATAIVIILVALGYGGYLYWESTRQPGADAPATEETQAEDHGAVLPQGLDPARLTPAGYDPATARAALEAAPLTSEEAAAIAAMLEAGAGNEALRDAALARLRAAYGI